MDTRDERILRYLATHRHGLTVVDAIAILGTTELRKAISNLRAKGHKIGDEWVSGVNRYGDEVKFKRYFLIKLNKRK